MVTAKFLKSTVEYSRVPTTTRLQFQPCCYSACDTCPGTHPCNTVTILLLLILLPHMLLFVLPLFLLVIMIFLLIVLINRHCVAGAVLHTPLLLMK